LTTFERKKSEEKKLLKRFSPFCFRPKVVKAHAWQLVKKIDDNVCIDD